MNEEGTMDSGARAALDAIVEALEGFDPETKVRILRSAAVFYGLISTLEGKEP